MMSCPRRNCKAIYQAAQAGASAPQMDAAAGAPPIEIARWRSCDAREAEAAADAEARNGDRDGDGGSQLGPSASRQSLFAAAGFEIGGDGGMSSRARSFPQSREC